MSKSMFLWPCSSKTLQNKRRSAKITSDSYAYAKYFQEWADSRLEWASESNYTNIRFLYSNEKYMWAPAVIVENS